MNTTVIVQRFLNILLVFLNVRGWAKGGLRPPTSLSCILLKTPSNNLLIQLVVTVFKHSVKSLGFPKYERLDKGGPKAPDKPLLYPPEQTSNNVVDSIGCHRVQTFCKGSWFS